MSLGYKNEFLNAVEALNLKNCSYVVVTLLEVRGSAPQNAGAKMIASQQGLEWGTIGGGKIEAAALDFAREFLQSGETSRVKSWNLQKDIKMSCGGEVTLSFEAMRAEREWTVAVFGAGHVGQKMVDLGVVLGAKISVFDTRKVWLNKILDRHSTFNYEEGVGVGGVQSSTAYLVEDLSSVIDLLSEQTQVVVMTMGHATDLPILKKALKRSFGFVGVMGSDVKASKIKKELAEFGLSLNVLSQLHCPIGKKLDSNQPEHIALTVWNQLLEIRESSARTK